MKTVKKIWGSEEWIVNRDYCGKILNLKKGFRGSIHHHKIKDETFYLLEGQVLLELENKKIILTLGDSIVIEPGKKHRFTPLEDSKIIEFSTHHEDSDTYRDTESEPVDLDKIKQELEKENVN